MATLPRLWAVLVPPLSEPWPEAEPNPSSVRIVLRAFFLIHFYVFFGGAGGGGIWGLGSIVSRVEEHEPSW